MQSLCILGRQPALGVAELESLYGAENLQPAGEQAVLVDIPTQDISFKRLGGTIKLCKVLTFLPTTDWRKIERHLIDAIPHHLEYLPEGKLQFGLSVYGLPITASQLQASGLSLKKIIRGAGRSARLTPNQEPALNSAQVLHNHLTGPLGWELVFVKDSDRTILAQTVAVQDIEAYAKRDQARPKRDARVGMLPPKLAQIVINLAVCQVKLPVAIPLLAETRDKRQETTKPLVLLDPFCGTGVILQEALLMDYEVYGSDIDSRMVEYTNVNLSWLLRQHRVSGNYSLEVGDATACNWPSPIDIIATEAYLGRPFSSTPKPEMLNEVMQDVNTITKKFLKNVTRQTKPGFRLCVAMPAWAVGGSFKHLEVLDSLRELGYNRISFVHVRNENLIYHREGQIVARELVILERK